jgi:hypothetical protein
VAEELELLYFREDEATTQLVNSPLQNSPAEHIKKGVLLKESNKGP